MCGIAGIFLRDSRSAINKELLLDMSDSLIHRGPDESGEYLDKGIGLAHRRLSIIDLASGKQPLCNEDGAVTVTYNGEIYNYKELMSELVARGHVFRTNSDTEVIVHAWEEWGKKCVDHFRGMFAFAIWDRNSESMFIARDRLGIKPLYYTLINDSELIFASELKAILQHPDIIRKLDYKAIQDYFSLGYIPEPKTIYKNIYKLPPARYLFISREEFRLDEGVYWDIQFSSNRELNKNDLIEELTEKLSEAVGIRLVSEVPIGAFLSGGVDSSAVVALMSEQSSSQITTCNIAFDQKEYNESVYARQIADKFQTRHFVEEIGTEHYNLLDKVIDVYDEPFADSSFIPTYKVCEIARKNMTVVLSGDGGDETFAGYRRHAMHMHEEKIRKLLPVSIRKPIFGILGKLYPKADWAPQFLRAKTTFQSLAHDSIHAYFNSVSVINEDVRSKLFSNKFFKLNNGYRTVDLFYDHAKNCSTDDPLSLIQYLDYKTYLPGDILTKVDRASMAHSLEVRVPILDHKFVEWASGIDSSLKLSGGNGKYIFKKAMEKYLPDNILHRKKMGFSVPIGKWLRHELRHELDVLTNNSKISELGIFNMNYVKKIVNQHTSGVRDHDMTLWSLLVFEKFLSVNI